MQRGEISAKFNCTARMQGPAIRGSRHAGLPTSNDSALFVLLLSLTRQNTRRLVAWEQEIALKCIPLFH